MGVRKTAGSAMADAQIVGGWKRYAARKVGTPEAVAEGACYLEPRPCPFEARPDFESRFKEDCVHCARLQGAVERVAPAGSGAAGAIPTLGLLLRLVEAEGLGSAAGAPRPADEDEEERVARATFLLRALPALHAASGARRTERALLASIAGAFSDLTDTILLFEVLADAAGLRLASAYRRADARIGPPPPEGAFDVETLAQSGAFDGEVFDRLRDEILPLDEDRDLLADAVFDGRAAQVMRPGQELRLPTILVEHLPDGPAAILPVFGRERVRYVLVLSSMPEIAGWTSDQMELLSAIAAQAGLAVEGGALLDFARRRGAAARAVHDLLAGLVKPAPAESPAETALRALADATESSHAAAWTLGPDGRHALACILGRPDAGEPDLIEVGESLRHWFEADATPMLLHDLGNDPRFPGGLPEAWGTALAVPLVADDRVWGSFLVVRESRLGAEPAALPYDGEDAALGTTIALLASLARSRDAARDVTGSMERRLRDAEAQLRHLEKVAVVGERGIQLAQDIRNPISAISGFAKRMLKGLPAGNENREYLEIILREADRLERVLAEQISMAQMTRPRLKLQSLNAIVQEALELQSEELVRRRVRLLKRLSPDLPSLLIDPDKIRQVLSNVLQHALQSVPSGGRVRVETRNGTGVVQAEVAHDGPKVAGETLDRLFVPFSTSRRYGAGVGLAVAYQMVREHGGEIRARSEGDWSSIVTIYLPVRENQDRRAKPDRRAGRNDRRRRLA
ncbi:MAG TPA: ATP-binding protein [Candidatus Eisenbacteria bacterium]